MSRPSLRSLAALVVLAGCGKLSTGSPIKVGLSGPFTESYGLAARRGVELAVAAVNEAGGVHGRKIELVVEDDSGDGSRAAGIAQKFVNDPDIVAVLGHVTSGAMVAASRVYDGHLAAVSPTATAQEITGLSKWVFRACPSDSVNGMAMARFASSQGRRRALVLYENDTYGRGLADSFRGAFQGTVVGTDPIDADGSSAETFVSWYRRYAPDVIVVAGVEPSGLAIIREARRQGLQPMFLGSDGWLGMPVLDPRTAEGVWMMAPFDPTSASPLVRGFLTAFTAKYQVTPDGNAALGYDAALAMIAAIERAGADREGIRQALEDMAAGTGVEGVTGTIRFGPSGDPVDKPFRPMQVRGGALWPAGRS